MQLDGLTIYQDRIKGLNTETVKRRCTVEKHRVLPDHIIEDGPDCIGLFFNKALRLLDIVDNAILDQLLHDKGLVEFKGHFRRKTTLVHPQFWSYDNNRTTGVVDTLTEQVLPETALLALKHVRKALQRPVGCTLDHTLAL